MPEAVRAVELKNHAAPDVRDVQAELTRIGGTVPPGFGPFSGEPVFKLMWGQESLAFEAGKMRIRFFDQAIDPIFTKRTFRMTQNALNLLARYQNLKARKMHEAGKRKDWDTYHALLFAPMEYFLKRFVPQSEWERLPGNSTFEETAKLLPDGWFYFEDLPDVLEIGTENFYVVQWLPPTAIDSRENWDIDRFGNHPLVEFYGEERFIDVLGPYPTYGEYWNVVLKIEAENGGYERPSRQNCIEKIEQKIHESRNRTKADMNLAARVEKRHDDYERKQKLASAARAETFKEIAHEEGQIVKVGNKARIFPKSRRPYYGKPKETINAEALRKSKEQK